MPLRLDTRSADFAAAFRKFLSAKREAAADVEAVVRSIASGAIDCNRQSPAPAHAGSLASRHPVFPALTPAEVGREQILKGDAVEHMVEGPPCRDMPDHEHPRALPPEAQIWEKAPDSLDGLPPTLPTGIGASR